MNLADLALLDATSVLTLLVGAVFVVVMLGDVQKWFVKAAAKPAAAATTAASSSAASPATTTASASPVSSPREAASAASEEGSSAQADDDVDRAVEPAAAEEPKAGTPASPPAETPAPAAAAADDDLDNLLDAAFEDLDAEENIVDQAWDNVHKDQFQVSTHVSGLNDLIQTGMKAMKDAAERSKEREKEEKVEKSREERSHRLKIQGNSAYAKKNYSGAISLYTSAITLLPEADPTKHILYSNRAAANYYAGRLQAAMNDSEKCIALNPKFIKGHMRKAYVLEERKEYQAAIDAFSKIIDDFAEDAMLEEAKEHRAACEARLADQLDSMCDDILDDMAVPSSVGKEGSPLD